MPDLLIELFSEEIPARMQARAREDLRRLVTDGLVEAGLTYASAGAFSTPRRLALVIEGLTAESRAVREERKGPRADAPAAALEASCARPGSRASSWSCATRKRARSISRWSRSRAAGPRPSWPRFWSARSASFPGPRRCAGVGQLALGAAPALDPLRAERRGRGARGAAGGGRIVAGNATRGHRFMAPAPFSVASFEDYRRS